MEKLCITKKVPLLEWWGMCGDQVCTSCRGVFRRGSKTWIENKKGKNTAVNRKCVA